MRFIHTADWHLGRFFHGSHLTAEQGEILLKELLPLAISEKAEALVIAGDIYDRGVPPVDAVELFDEVLAKFSEANIKVIGIAGNHDSPGRVDFGRRLFAGAGIYLRGKLEKDMAPVTLEDEYGAVDFYLVPYFDALTVRDIFGGENLDKDAAYDVLLANLLQSKNRSVALIHDFIAGGISSDSERPLAVAGGGNVSPEHFARFNYTALGHLHNPQKAGGENIRYSGSLMKYSFDEWEQKKGVVLVDIDGAGEVRTEFFALKSRRDVRRIKGSFQEILENRERYPKSDDYLEFILTDKVIIPNSMQRLREIFPNAMLLSYDSVFEQQAASIKGQQALKKSEENLFAQFYLDTMGHEMSAEETALFAEVIAEVRREEREG